MDECVLVSKFVNCVNFAAVKHKNQMRKDMETPYINHPIGVAYNLTSIGEVYDPTIIQAALLHDTVEDTATSIEEIKEHFGDAVGRIVEEVTEIGAQNERKQSEIERARTISREAKLVRLADKLYNLRDLERKIPNGWTEERAKNYVIWSQKVIDNLRGTNQKLEDELDKIFQRHGLLK